MDEHPALELSTSASDVSSGAKSDKPADKGYKEQGCNIATTSCDQTSK